MPRSIKKRTIIQRYANKHANYNKEYEALKLRLAEVLKGTDPEYLDRLADLDEERDMRLYRLKVLADYQRTEATNLYEVSFGVITRREQEHTELLRQRLIRQLEQQSKQLNEDKITTDMSHSGELLKGVIGDDETMGPSKPSRTRPARETRRKGLRNPISYASNNSDSGSDFPTDKADATDESRIMSELGFMFSDNEDRNLRSDRGSATFDLSTTQTINARSKKDRMPPLSVDDALKDLAVMSMRPM